MFWDYAYVSVTCYNWYSFITDYKINLSLNFITFIFGDATVCNLIFNITWWDLHLLVGFVLPSTSQPSTIITKDLHILLLIWFQLVHRRKYKPYLCLLDYLCIGWTTFAWMLSFLVIVRHCTCIPSVTAILCIFYWKQNEPLYGK